ncbi:hypothetical protein [Spirosoma arcticum]
MSRHLKLAFAYLSIAACCLYGCQPRNVDPRLPPDYVAIKAGASAQFGSGLTVRVDSISDSRCPIGFNCLIAGWASASVTVGTEANSQKQRLIAGWTYKDRRDSITVQVRNVAYKLILRDVTPYPSSKNLRPVQQAIIQVSRL